MTNILTPAEAALFVRTDEDDAILNMLLPQVDAFVQRATGRDWTADVTINEVAKAAAGMLLVTWYDTPSQSGSLITDSPLSFGLHNVLSQLEAEALKYRKAQISGASAAGGIAIPGALLGDIVVSVTGVYGVSGNQSASFETSISVAGQIQQTSGSNLSNNLYVVILKSPADDVSA